MSEWITQAEAARLAGCSNTVIERYLQEGRIARRWPRGRKTPSVNRESAEEFAAWWRHRQTEAEQRRLERALRRAAPPDDDGVWLDAATAALLLAWTPQYVARLAARERIPALKRGSKWWLRRIDVEIYAAARAFRARVEPRSRLAV